MMAREPGVSGAAFRREPSLARQESATSPRGTAWGPSSLRPPDGSAGRSSRQGSLWTRLNVAWVTYFVVVFTVGRSPDYQQAVIWIGGLLVAGPTTFWMLRERVGVPRAARPIWAFAVWGLIGITFVPDRDSFWRYFSLVVEMAGVITFISVVIERSGKAKIWLWAFLAVGVVNATAGDMLDVAPLALAGIAVERQEGIAGNPNAFGLVCFLGVLGGMLLTGMEQKRWKAVALSVVTLVPAIGVLLSASRAAFLALLLAVIGWPVVCGWRRLRHPWGVAVATFFLWLAVGDRIVHIFENSTMGKRVLALEQGHDRSGKVRASLARVGLALTAEEPVFGVGLGQFAEASGTGFYAHGDWIEVLATTGVPGFLFYVGGMIAVGRRLMRQAGLRLRAGMEDTVRGALLALFIILVTGAITWPHSLTPQSMFVLGVVFGIAELAGRSRLARKKPGPAGRDAIGLPARVGAA